MNIAEQALETSRAVFMEHKKDCKSCKRFTLHKTATLSYLCFHGTTLYKALLKAEDVLVTRAKSAEQAKETRAINRKRLKQMEQHQ